jgi:hypothetical protein
LASLLQGFGIEAGVKELEKNCRAFVYSLERLEELHEDVIAEVIIGPFRVALIAEAVVFAVGALEEPADHRLLSAVLAIRLFERNLSRWVGRFLFELERRKYWEIAGLALHD